MTSIDDKKGMGIFIESFDLVKTAFFDPIPQKEFLGAGLLGLMSKANGWGSAQRFIHEYVGDALSPFGFYFLAKSSTKNDSSHRKSTLKCDH